MTTRHCFQLAELVSLLSSLYFLMSPCILCFFLLSLHWGSLLGNVLMCLWFPQLNLILGTAVVGTFPFFNAWFNVVQLTSIVFLFPLPLVVSSPPNGQIIVCVRYSCHGLPWHIYCLFCYLVRYSIHLIPVCPGILHRIICFSCLLSSASMSYI